MDKIELGRAFGAYPTMVTPYTENGAIDYSAVRQLTDWYSRQGCDGIFASCQSSEIAFLTEDERVGLVDCVRRRADELARCDKSRAPLTIVASGHVSDRFEDQARELCRVADAGADAVILITNRMDIENTNDDNWIRDAERLLKVIPEHVMLGLYECPAPYKRLLTERMLSWCLSTGRFRYIKDTCCDEAEIERRLALLDGSPLRLFNANAQTLLPSLRAGGAGYCGIMCNFHPELYVWLTHNFKRYPQTAELVGNFLSMTAFTESLRYPITAKYHLSKLCGIPMSLYSRSRSSATIRPYDAMCVEQMNNLAKRMAEYLQDIKEEEAI